MKTLAIGDIHGCLDMLCGLLDFVNLAPNDRLVFLGDYVDRGPDSRRLLDWLIDQGGRREIITLRGNHEILMMQSRINPMLCLNWLAVGGAATLASYGWDGSSDWQELIPNAHWNFLAATRPWMETDNAIFVHATAEPHLTMEEHDDAQLYWNKCRQLPPHHSGKRVIVGHTRQTSGQPRCFEGGVCIDTAAVSGHWLTCLDADTGDYWQINPAGQTRHRQLAFW